MRIVKGNLVSLIQDGTQGYFLHQVNCRKVAGAGLAKQIADTFPAWLEQFRAVEPKLGTFSLFFYGNMPQEEPCDLSVFPCIVNLYAQDAYGRNKPHTDYEALASALLSFRSYMFDSNSTDQPIYIPYGMGCGLGGGKWDTVIKLIQMYLDDFDIIIVQLPNNPTKPARKTGMRISNESTASIIKNGTKGVIVCVTDPQTASINYDKGFFVHKRGDSPTRIVTLAYSPEFEDDISVFESSLEKFSAFLSKKVGDQTLDIFIQKGLPLGKEERIVGKEWGAMANVIQNSSLAKNHNIVILTGNSRKPDAPKPIESFKGKYEFLSNFSAVEIATTSTVGGKEIAITYPSVEHAYQAAKSPVLKDRLIIAGLREPGQARWKGKNMRCIPNWNDKRGYIMGELLRIKFAPGTEMAKKLLATGNLEIVHLNTWDDTYFGVIEDESKARIGENILGRILMKIRKELVNTAQLADLAENYS